MYNNFIHTQKINQQNKTVDHQNQQYSWKRKYQIEIRPTLISHYEKRVASFIQQVDEKPLQMTKFEKNNSCQHLRKFVLRDREDWTSFKTTINKQSNADTRETKTIRRVMSQDRDRFSNAKQEFRQRKRQMELHPPMMFGRPYTSDTPRSKRSNPAKAGQKNMNLTTCQAQDRLTDSMKRNESHGTMKSTHQNPLSSKFDQLHQGFDYFRQSKFDNIQIEAQLYQKKQEIVQKKLHFKKLLNMSLVNKSSQSRMQFRKILEKNGYVNVKKNKSKIENEELDHLSLIIQDVDSYIH